MAKLKAPLMSLGASGQLGKALVFFPWKGLNVVREFVIPSNPQTTLQNAQRAWLRAAVIDIHLAEANATQPLDEIDTMAYALWGSTYPTPRTWFNQAVKNWVDMARLTGKPAVYRGGSTGLGAGNLGVYIYSDRINAAGDCNVGWFYYGTSKTALINRIAAVMDWATNSASATIPGLTAGVKYFWQFRPDAGEPAVGALSGIYYGTPT